ncbi:MAG: hypothetical protein RL660_2837 [Bacteroidota bacterium]
MVKQYISTGDGITSIPSPLPETYANALLHYDSALQVAKISNNDYLLAISYNSVGKAYEAWNQNPEKTLEYFALAIQHYKRHGKMPYDEKYTRFLMAHAYMKNKAYNEADVHLDTLCKEIVALPDSTKKQLDFSVLIARTYSFAGRYQKAQESLNTLTKREWIKNNDSSYQFLYYYYVVNAQIDVYDRKNYASVYLDSCNQAFNKVVHIGDVVSIGGKLIDMYKHMGNDTKAKSIQSIIDKKIEALNVSNDNDLKAAKIISKLNINKIQKDVAQKSQQLSKYQIMLMVITGLALIAAALALYLIRSNRKVSSQKSILDKNILELEKRNNEIELLNKEMHHRVKNNLQTIQSLLVMQEKRSDDEQVSDIMKEMRTRIDSMANLHHHLLEDEKNVNLSEYVQDLINNAVSLLSHKKNIITHINVNNIVLPHKNIFALGLIINEWVTNSAKYANANKDALVCYLQITNANKTILLEYYDSGTTNPPQDVQTGLGLHIVNLLTKQIQGTLKRADNNPYHYYLSIPQDES